MNNPVSIHGWRRDMKIHRMHKLWGHIYYFIVLSEQKSFTSAATRLNISKSTISQRVNELEQAIGVPLVYRTTRSMRLTDAGRLLVNETRPLFEQIALTFKEVHDLGGAPSGLLRITAPVALGRQHITPLLTKFVNKYPSIRFELDLSDDLKAIASDGFDMAIRHIDSPPEDYVAKSIARTRTFLVANPNYLAQKPPLMHPAQLVRYRQLLYPRQRGSGSWSFEYIGRDPVRVKHTSVRIHADFVANNSEVLRKMVCDGAGVALLPDFSAQVGLAAGHLVQLLPEWRPVGTFGRRIYLLRPYSKYLSRTVRVCWDYFIENFPRRFPT